MKLKGHVKAVSQRNRNNRCCAVYSVTNSRGFTPSTDYFSKEIYSKDLSTYKLVEKGMIAYNPSRINVGSVALQDKAECVIVSPLYVVFCVDETLLCPEYVTYFLKSEPGLRQIDFRSIGTVRNNFTFDALEKMELRVPSVGDQLHVVSIIRRVESVIESTKQKSNQLDDLVKSRFVEMFGDLLKNSKGQTLDDISELITVGIANAATHAYADKGTIMFRNLNIRENRLDDTDLISIRPEFAAKYKKKALKSGDILVTRTGYPGVACIVPEKYAGCQTFTTLIVRLDASSGASATFVSQYINSPLGKEYVNKMKAGSSQQNFGATSLKSMPIVVPPLALQQEFADFVSQVDKLRFETQQQIEKLETLKKSLMQKYFG